jgi:hypothetical protein
MNEATSTHYLDSAHMLEEVARGFAAAHCEIASTPCAVFSLDGLKVLATNRQLLSILELGQEPRSASELFCVPTELEELLEDLLRPSSVRNRTLKSRTGRGSIYLAASMKVDDGAERATSDHLDATIALPCSVTELVRTIEALVDNEPTARAYRWGPL